ncbi:MAG TPA: YMGG-like glycine zipper-containing protein [Rhodocyclaceae bacterium]|nr:YMGG-like glycine zipper-containing protein [Rhodocyclaceae bacterium]
MKTLTRSIAAGSLLLIGACAVTPDGPSVMALPGSGKSFEQFRIDDAACRDYALTQVGGTTANQAATDAAVRSAAVGTAIGAVAGAAIGGRDGAGVGAGTGLLFGSAAGSNAAYGSSGALQRRYDNAYIQCMYAKGQKVPVSRAYMQDRTSGPGDRRAPAYPPPPPGNPPPPPPGY